MELVVVVVVVVDMGMGRCASKDWWYERAVCNMKSLGVVVGPRMER